MRFMMVPVQTSDGTNLRLTNLGPVQTSDQYSRTNFVLVQTSDYENDGSVQTLDQNRRRTKETPKSDVLIQFWVKF